MKKVFPCGETAKNC